MESTITKKLIIKILSMSFFLVSCILLNQTIVHAAEPDTVMYLFNNDTYIRYDYTTDSTLAGYPRSTSGGWDKVPWSTFDTAFMAPNGKIYIFKGNQYIRYDWNTDKMDPGYPAPIKGNWGNLPWDSIDSAVMWPNGCVYFFKGTQYVRYDFEKDYVSDSYPRNISGNWGGLPWDSFDSALTLPNGKAYFFKNGQYIRYDIASDHTDQPVYNIKGSWNVPDSYTQKINAAIWWPRAKGDLIAEYSKRFLGTPYLWGGTTPAGFDCSGLVQYVYKCNGITIARDTYNQIYDGIEASKDDLRPGDIVFFGDYNAPGHEGLYIGRGQFIQAPKTGDVVKITNLSDRHDFSRARRIVQ